MKLGLSRAWAAMLLAGPAMTLPASAEPVAAQAAAPSLKPGENRLANGAIAYRPRTVVEGAYPVIVMLHGASGYPLDFLQSMEPVAEKRGAILLMPHSVGRTWDLIENATSGRDPWRGPDTGRLTQSLADLLARAAVDRSRIVLLGFSDGASYALSLGVINPGTFKTVIALSPGTMLLPRRIDPAQRLFVAHGRNDRMLPFENTAGTLVPALRALGANVTFRTFNGDHEIDRKVLDEALDLALGLQP